MSSDTLESWIDALGSNDVMEQIAAQDKLIKSSDPRAVSQLLSKVASDEGWSGKVNAGLVIHKLGSRAVEPLLQVLRQGEPKQKSLAAEMLGIIRDAKAVDPLIEALKDAEATVRSRSAASLGALGDARAFAPLLQALADQEKSVQSNAAASLGRLRDPDAFAPLLSALQSSSVPGAALGLGHLGDKRALPSLIAGLLSEDKDMRRCAAIGLGHLGDGSAMDELITALGDQEASVRQGAVFALGKLRDTRASEPLCRLLQDSDKTVRWRVAEALGDVGDARAVDSLNKALNDDYSLVRSYAQKALDKLRDPTSKSRQDNTAHQAAYTPPRAAVQQSPPPTGPNLSNRGTAAVNVERPNTIKGGSMLTICRVWWTLRRLRKGSCRSSAKAVDALVACGEHGVPLLIRAISSFHPHELLTSFHKDVSVHTDDLFSGRDPSARTWGDHSQLRLAAVEALGKIGDRSAVTFLSKVVFSEYRREFCALGNKVTAHAVERTESFAIVDAAVASLGSLGGGDALRILAAAIGLTAFPDAGVFSSDQCDALRKAIVAALNRAGDHDWDRVKYWHDVYVVDSPHRAEPLKCALREVPYLDLNHGWNAFPQERLSWDWPTSIARICQALVDTNASIPTELLSKALEEVHLYELGFKKNLTAPHAPHEWNDRALTQAVQTCESAALEIARAIAVLRDRG